MSTDETEDSPRPQPSPINHIGRICEAFEQAWFGGRRAKIEDFLVAAPDLLHELLVTELECRHRRGEAAKAEEYKRRFPDYQSVVDLAFKEHEARALDSDGWDLGKTIHHDHSGEEAKQRELDSRYVILEKHAEGGLGIVYRAFDRELSREVALKEIKGKYANDAASQERFIFEAKITGTLEHPGIVPVHGLGRHDDTRPYYAMRFLEGPSLKDAIAKFHHPNRALRRSSAERNTELRALLRHFINVCNTVQYAHSRGVLHRDLKPANVLIGEHGETIVVDWGLAKRVPHKKHSAGTGPSTDSSLDSGSNTMLGSAIGTPYYMSPEQADGRHDEVDARTDIYSLGATLFSLLTGEHPISGKTTTELIEKVKRGETLKAREVNPLVAKPLEAICERAMQLRPSDRYSEAKQLAMDVERWLADERVTAYANMESRSEQAGRWLRKHRTWARAIAATLLVVVCVSTSAAVLIDRARRSEQAAKEIAVVAKSEASARFVDSRAAIDKWLTGTSEALQHFPGMYHVRERLLDQAMADYERLAETKTNDQELEIERARTRLRIGDLHLQRANVDQAEKWYQDAGATFAELTDRFPDSLNAQLGVANSRAKLAWLYTSSVRYPDAAAQFHGAIRRVRAAQTEYPKDPRCSELLGTVLLNYAHCLARQGKLGESDEALSDASIELEQVPELATRPDIVLKLATVDELSARNASKRGNHEVAIDHLREAISSLDTIVRTHRDEPRYLDAQSEFYIALAASLRATGLFSDSSDALQQAADNYAALASAIPDTPRYILNLALTQTDIGMQLHEIGRSADAADELAPARASLEELVASYGSHPNFHNGLGACEDAMARALADLGQTAEAETMFENAISRFGELAAVYDGEYGYVHRLALARSRYAQLLQKSGVDASRSSAQMELEEAERILTELVRLQPNVPEYEADLAELQNELGMLYLITGSGLRATRAFRNAHDRLQRLADTQATPMYFNRLATFLSECPDEKVGSAPKAAEIAAQATSEAPKNASYWSTLAVAQYRNRAYQDCVASINRAIDLRPGDNAHDLFILAMSEHGLQNREASRKAFEAANSWMNDNQPMNSRAIRLRDEASELLGIRGAGIPADRDSAPGS